MSIPRLALLGGFALRDRDGERLEVGMRKAKALLAWLALHPGEPQSRDKLAGLLWAESGDSAARHSLRQALTSLRRALPDPERMLASLGDRIQLAAGELDCDVLRFRELAVSRHLRDLERAVSLYCGELLEGFIVRSPEFEDWMATERSRLREQACALFDRLLAHHQSASAWEPALRAAVGLLSLEPLREPVVRQAMELELRLGRQAEALRRYRSFQVLLKRELDIGPEPETRDLHRRILARRSEKTGPAGARVTGPDHPRAGTPGSRDRQGLSSAWPGPAVLPEVPQLPGRDSELRQVDGILDACLATGAGSVLLVRGDSGIGKTALLDAVETRAAGRGFAAHRAYLFHPGTDAPAASAASLIRELSPTSEGLPELRAKLEAFCAEQDDVLFLLDALGEPLSAVEEPFFRALDPAERRAGLSRALGHLLACAVRERPRLILVEDVHWADSGFLSLLAALAVEVVRLPALLVLTSRNLGEPFDPDWRGAMPRVALTTLDLARLDTQAVMMIAQRQGIADQPWVRHCVARAGGNPLFLEHLLHAGPELGDALPSSVAALVQRRLAALPLVERQAVQAAAVLGQRFSVSVLERLLEASVPWSGIEASGLLCREGGWARFTHALVCDGVLDAIPEPSRRALHVRAAGVYQQEDAVLFAEHMAHAGHPAAAEACLGAARDCLQRHRYDAAKDLARRALGASSDPEHKAAAGLFLGALCRDLGEVDAALQVLTRAIDDAADDSHGCDARIELAATLLVQDRYAEALARLRDARPVAQSLGDAPRLARLMLQQGNAHFALGQVEQCMSAHRAALEAASTAEDPELRARALSGLGDAHYQQGRMITAHHYFDRCVRLCEAQGLVRLQAPNLSGRAMSVMYLNRLEDALTDAANAVRLATLTRSLRDQCLARNVLAIAAYYAGDSELAERESEAGLATAREVGLRRFEADHLTMLGAVKTATGRSEQGLPYLMAAWELVRDDDMAYAGPIVLGYRAQATDDDTRRSEDLALAERALQGDSLSHNHFQFRYSALEIAIDARDPSAVKHHAKALEAYTRDEPLPWSELVANAARALVASSSDAAPCQRERRLEMLAAEAHAAGLMPLARRLRAAIEGCC